MRSLLTLCLLGLSLLGLSLAAHAGDLDDRVERLARELRCVVCQGQSVAESNAPLAVDMKAHLREGLAAGRSEDDLRAEMVQRYGEQVLFRPGLHAGTAPLWFGPLVLLGLGGLIYWRQARRQDDPS
ncbi:MAG: cytochrome c-type biogenesis protein CcmH [Burkholderiales bacterium]|nr:MAG: cytochrome c-type biogenesis protein CcmH [Burkholderiales bacterium]